MINHRVSVLNGQHIAKCIAFVDEVAMREHHALRRAGRPAGVEESRERALGEIVGQVRGFRGREKSLVPCVEIEDVLDHFPERVGMNRREEHLRPGILERVPQLGFRVARVERDDDHASPGYGLVDLEVAVTVGSDDRDRGRRRRDRARAARRPVAGIDPRSRRR